MYIIRRSFYLTGFWAGLIGGTGSVRIMDVIDDNTGVVVVSAKARAEHMKGPPGRWGLGSGVGGP